MKKKLSGIMAILLSASLLTACGDTEAEEEVTQSEYVNTTTTGLEINTETLASEQQEKLDSVAEESDLLRDVELENKTIKWLAHYDINPNNSGTSKSVQLELFESKYGGKIEWYPTTWEARYTDLLTYVLGGEGIDFFPVDTEAVPKGVNSGVYQAIDDYIDLDSKIWQKTANAMELFNFNGHHYELCVGVSPMNVVYYSKKTISENGFDDPWELYQNGEWNWDSFKSMLEQFVDVDNERYGLDGWYYQNALKLSAGKPAVTSENGVLTLNMYDPQLEKAMTFAEDLFVGNLCLDLSQFGWTEQPHFMGEGKELFYICGQWATTSDPTLWGIQVAPEDLGIVPVPCPADSTPAYAITADGFLLCKGSQNPEGVALYAECCIAADAEPNTKEIGREKLKNDAKWSDALIEQYDECVRLAQEYPVYELGYGVSADFDSVVTSYATYNPFRGEKYSTLREETIDVAQQLLDQCNEELKTAQ